MSLPKPDSKRNYGILTQTPYANSLTKDFAIATIVNENLGKDDKYRYYLGLISRQRKPLLKILV